MKEKLRDIIKDEIQELEDRISGDILLLERLCEVRQKAGALKNAYSNYGLHVMEIENRLKISNLDISETKMNIEANSKNLYALQEYLKELEDSEKLKIEKSKIDDDYPLISY